MCPIPWANNSCGPLSELPLIAVARIGALRLKMVHLPCTIPARKYAAERVIALDVVMKQCSRSMQANQEIASRPDDFVYFLDLLCQVFVLADQCRQLQTKERYRFSVCAEDEPTGQWHGYHQHVEGNVHQMG